MSILAIFLIGVLALCGLASATPNSDFGSLVDIQSVEVDDTEMFTSGINTLSLERNSEVEVKVVLKAITDLEDIQVEAYMRGYDHDDRIEDITDVFDMKANVSYSKKLHLKLAERMDQDLYLLRIRIEGRNGGTKYQDYKIEVDTARHALQIKDIILTPENRVKAGRALLAAVRVKNYGEKDEEGIKVQVSIPELGVSASDYIDELEADESTTSEEIYLRIPSDAESGVYKVKVQLTYDDGDEKVSKETEIEVEGEEVVTEPVSVPETVITVGPEEQDVTAGKGGVIYPLTITNRGKESRTYTISVEGVDEWGTTKISPTNVLVVGSGETKAAYISVAANQGTPEGKRMFGVTISSNSETLKQIPLTANVVSGEEQVPPQGWFGIRRGLEIGLVILVVLLVIIGLIIGFNKLKGSEEEEESEDKTYY